MEQKIALKVNSKDNVATIFADDVIVGSIVALREGPDSSQDEGAAEILMVRQYAAFQKVKQKKKY